MSDSDTGHLSPEEVAELEGTPNPADQDALLDPDELEGSDTPTDTEVYEGELEAEGGLIGSEDTLRLDELASREDREGETDDPTVAAEEGEPWIPPIDPPVVADATSPDGMRIAAGFGASAEDEPFDADHHGTLLPLDDEVSARVREALFADARTSRLADAIDVETDGGVVTLRGTVDDIEDSDLLAEVASEVTGVVDVNDETDVEGL